MRGTIFFIIIALLFLLLVMSLLRSRKLREKYAALWIIIGLLSVILALFPRLLSWLARLVGVQVPSNLLFVLAISLLLGLSLQLSLEVSRAEERVRVLAEHVAILDAQNRDAKIVPASPKAEQPGSSDPDEPDRPVSSDHVTH